MSASIKITTHDQLQSVIPAKKRRSPLRPWTVILLILVCAVIAVWLHRRRANRMLLPSVSPMAQESNDLPDAAVVQSDPLPDTFTSEPHLPDRTPSAQQAKTLPDSRTSQATEQSPQPSAPHLVAQETVHSLAVDASPPVSAAPQSMQKPPEKPIGIRLGQTTLGVFEIALRVPEDARSRSLREIFIEKQIIDVLVTPDTDQKHAIGRATLTSWQEKTERNVVDVVLSLDKVPDLSELVLLTNARLAVGSKIVLVSSVGKELTYPFSVNIPQDTFNHTLA